LSKNHTVQKPQLEAINQVLRQLSDALSPQFLGLVTTSGQTLTYLSAAGFNNADSLASLAAGSFAATRELARLMQDHNFTMMFQEGGDLNIHIAQVTEEVLLVICFRKSTQIGKVRLMTSRALSALSLALEAAPDDIVMDKVGQVADEDEYARGVSKTIDELFTVEGE
jgi:predicted regulator of Ras-like GTPase activity (Roadblock/LC7/MglB family)